MVKWMACTYLFAALAQSEGFQIIGVVATHAQLVLDWPQKGLDVFLYSVTEVVLDILLKKTRRGSIYSFKTLR